MPSADKVRWGILGPGGIANRLLQDCGHASKFTVVASGSRSMKRASEFAACYGIPKVYGSGRRRLVPLAVLAFRARPRGGVDCLHGTNSSADGARRRRVCPTSLKNRRASPRGRPTTRQVQATRRMSRPSLRAYPMHKEARVVRHE